MSTIKDLIDAIAEGNTLDIESSFNSIVSQKIADRLEDMKINIASDMFSEDVINERKTSKKLEKLENTRQQRKVHDDHVLARREKYYNFSESVDLDEACKGCDGEYHKDNPKIDLYHKDGHYLASTNHSTTVKHAVAGYEKAYPQHAGKVKGSIDRR